MTTARFGRVWVRRRGPGLRGLRGRPAAPKSGGRRAERTGPIPPARRAISWEVRRGAEPAHPGFHERLRSERT